MPILSSPICGYDPEDARIRPIRVDELGRVSTVAPAGLASYTTEKNNATLKAGESFTSAPIDCREYPFWGFSFYATRHCYVTIEYSIDKNTWRQLEVVDVAANTPLDAVYRATRPYYRVAVTSASSFDGNVDLVIVRTKV